MNTLIRTGLVTGGRSPGSGAITINSHKWLLPNAVTFPGGATASLNYDNLLRLTGINVKDPAQNDVMNYGYIMDEVGNILNQQTEHGAYTFGYDDLDRLTTADNPNLADETYTYDPVGNRLADSNRIGAWGYNANNQLTDIGTTTTVFGYDDNGSLTSKTEGATTTTYDYNLENRLSEVRQGTATIASYYYDPFGRRLSKNVGGIVTYFMYADEGLIAEFDATGTPIRQYGYQPDSLWGTDPTYLKTGGQYYYYQNDHLGTPKKLTAPNGQAVWSSEYQVFGDLQFAANSSIDNPLRFAGQYEDGETGLYYNFNRYYDPNIGRYVSSDPIGLAGGINPYHYANLSPTTMIDPEGKFGFPGAAVGGITAALCSPNRGFNWEYLKDVGTGVVSGFFGGWIGVGIGVAAAAANDYVKDCEVGYETVESGIVGATGEVVQEIADGSASSNYARRTHISAKVKAPGIYGSLASCVTGAILNRTRPPVRDPITGEI